MKTPPAVGAGVVGYGGEGSHGGVHRSPAKVFIGLLLGVISVLFTTTPDLTAEFPAVAARRAGFTDVPLLCASEVAVPGALPRVVRLLAHVEVERRRGDLRHVYLRGAEVLRRDIAQEERDPR